MTGLPTSLPPSPAPMGRTPGADTDAEAPDTETLDIVAVEPWFSGSHRDFLVGLQRHSRHRIRLLTLPGRFWKWRQTGSGMVLAERALDMGGPCDLILASDFLHLPDFLAATRRLWPGVPSVMYFHENQLTYPVQAGHELDRAYPLANLSGVAVADAVWFNSGYHRDAFLAAIDPYLATCPDHPPRKLGATVAARSRVMPLGVNLADIPRPTHADTPQPEPLTILWNHRWEHDKNPAGFFAVLGRLAETGAEFRVIVVGQSFGRVPEAFAEGRAALGDRILQWGFVQDRADYLKWLAQADVVISLAHHDFFGVAVVEAMAAGCLPLLANRLNYPALVSPAWHERCLVDNETDALARLQELAAHPEQARNLPTRDWADPYDWHHMAPQFDQGFTDTHHAFRAARPA